MFIHVQSTICFLIFWWLKLSMNGFQVRWNIIYNVNTIDSLFIVPACSHVVQCLRDQGISSIQFRHPCSKIDDHTAQEQWESKDAEWTWDGNLAFMLRQPLTDQRTNFRLVWDGKQCWWSIQGINPSQAPLSREYWRASGIWGWGDIIRFLTQEYCPLVCSFFPFLLQASFSAFGDSVPQFP